MVIFQFYRIVLKITVNYIKQFVIFLNQYNDKIKHLKIVCNKKCLQEKKKINEFCKRNFWTWYYASSLQLMDTI